MTINKPRVAAFALCLAASGLAFADAGKEAGPYLGIAVGSGGASFKSAASVYASSLPVGASTKKDSNSAAGRIFAGYQFNPYVAVEGAIVVLGKYKSTDRSGADSLTNDIRVSGVTFDVLGSLPISERFSVYAGIGAAYMKASSKAVVGGAVTLDSGVSTKQSHSAFSPHARIGAVYALSEQWDLRLDIDGYKHVGTNLAGKATGRSDMNSWNIGVSYRF